MSKAIWNTWYVTFEDDAGDRWAVKKEHGIGDWTFCEDPTSAYVCGSREEARKVRDEMAATEDGRRLRGIIVLRPGARRLSFEEYNARRRTDSATNTEKKQ